MSLTNLSKVTTSGIATGTSLLISNVNSSGVVTASTVQVGSATTIHTTGIDLGGGNITSHNINSTGIITSTSFVGPVTGNVTGDLTGNVSSSGANTLGSLTVTNDATVGGALTITGDLTVNGTTTTIDTAVTAVDSLAIDGDASVGGSVGIGTDNPSYSALHISGSPYYGATLRLTNTGTSGGDYFILSSDSSWTAGGDKLLIGRGTPATSNTKIVLDSSGNIGIGLTNPQNLLHIKSGTSGASSYDSRYKLILENSGEQYIGFYNNDNSYSGIRFNNTTTILGSIDYYYTQNYLEFYSNGEHVFKTRQGGSSAERLRITSGGNIGIGTTNPDGKLDVRGSLFVGERGAADTHIEVGSGRIANGYAYLDLIGDTSHVDYGLRIIRGNSGANTGSGIIHRGTGELYLNATDAGSIAFYTSNAPRVAVTSGGNIGIGTATPHAKLEVSGGQNQTANQFTDLVSISANANNDGIGAEVQLNFGISPSHTAEANRKARIQSITHNDNPTPLAINPAGGNIGIGTDNPGERLDVDGSIRLRAAGNYTTYATRLGARLDSTHCTTLESYLNSSTPFELIGSYADSGGANPRVVLAAGGQRVGIGSDNPGAKLDIYPGTSSDTIPGLKIARDWGSISGHMVRFDGNPTGGGDGNVLLVRGGGTRADTETFEVRNGNGTTFVVKGNGAVGIGTDDPGSNTLQIQGDTISVGNIHIDGKEVYYTGVYSTNGWGNSGNWYTVCPHTLASNSMYLVAIVWDWGGNIGQPYYLGTQTLYSTINGTNGSGSENELTPLCSTHTGSSSARINVRTLAQSGGGTNALQVNLTGFTSGSNSKLTVKCWRVMYNTRSGV